MSSADEAIQAALVERVSSLGLTCVDFGREVATWPYVEAGYVTLAPFDTQTSTGFEFTATLHVRSRSGSAKETKGIQGQLYAALHRQSLAVEGFQTVLVNFVDSRVLEPVGSAFHGVSEFRGLITT